MKKAILGIIGGLVLAGVAWTGGTLFDPQHEHQRLWFALAFLSWPALAFGAFCLAQWRGYPGEVGLISFGAGLLVHLGLVHWVGKPVADALGILFEAALPAVLIFALPPRSMPFQKPLKQVRKQALRAD